MFLHVINSASGSEIEDVKLLDLIAQLLYENWPLIVVKARHFLDNLIENYSLVASRFSWDVKVIQLLLKMIFGPAYLLGCGTFLLLCRWSDFFGRWNHLSQRCVLAGTHSQWIYFRCWRNSHCGCCSLLFASFLNVFSNQLILDLLKDYCERGYLWVELVRVLILPIVLLCFKF